MIMVGFSGTTVPDSLKVDLISRGLGGVILYAGNVQNPSQIKQLTKQLQSNSQSTLLIAIDQEGGQVARLSQNNGYVKTKTAYNLGTVINILDTTSYWVAKMAQWLYDGGININFAPVVDVDVNPNSPAIGALERSFSSNPANVYNHAQKFIDEFSKKKIAVTLKHFPGHGSAMQDSHLGFTDITNTWADSELVPYRKLFQNNYSGLVMVGHLFNAHIDPLYPASLSNNTVTGLLRNQLGFQGVTITDALEMNAISDNYSFDKTVELAVNAGEDILLFTTNILNNRSLLDSVVNIIFNKINSGIIAQSTIDDAYNRITFLKQGLINSVSETAGSQIVKGYAISNYPNPFNPETDIVVDIPAESNISVNVYNITGQLVRTIFNGSLSSGRHSFVFTGRGLPSGIYLVSMNTGNNMVNRKIVLLK